MPVRSVLLVEELLNFLRYLTLGLLGFYSLLGLESEGGANKQNFRVKWSRIPQWGQLSRTRGLAGAPGPSSAHALKSFASAHRSLIGYRSGRFSSHFMIAICEKECDYPFLERNASFLR